MMILLIGIGIGIAIQKYVVPNREKIKDYIKTKWDEANAAE